MASHGMATQNSADLNRTMQIFNIYKVMLHKLIYKTAYKILTNVEFFWLYPLPVKVQGRTQNLPNVFEVEMTLF